MTVIADKKSFFTTFPIEDSSNKEDVKEIKEKVKKVLKSKDQIKIVWFKTKNWKKVIIVKNWPKNIITLFNLVYDKDKKVLKCRNDKWQIKIIDTLTNLWKIVIKETEKFLK